MNASLIATVVLGIPSLAILIYQFRKNRKADTFGFKRGVGEKKQSKKSRRTRICVDCGGNIDKEATRCVSCNAKQSRKSKRPNAEELQKLMSEFNFVQLGKKFEVSDNAVRKWARSYGLSTKKYKCRSGEQGNHI